MDIIFPILILVILFTLGLICINNPFAVARTIARWFRFVSGNSFEYYKSANNQLNDVFELMDKPSSYMKRFSRQIDIIRFTGYVAIFIAVTGTGIIICGGVN